MSSGPKQASLTSLGFTPRFAYGNQAEIAEVSGAGDGTALGTGFVRMRDAAIPWTIQYDEVVLVLEGHLTIVVGEDRFEAGPMETIFLPAGTGLVYEARSALVFYAIHPADWAMPKG